MLLQFAAASLSSFCSINLRPSHRPVLIACSMQKWRGKTWYHLSHEWCHCLQSTRPYLVVSIQSVGVSNVQEAKKVLLLVQAKNACVKCVPSIREPSHFCQVIAVNKTSPGLKEIEEQKICHTWGRSCLALQPPKSGTELRSSAGLFDQFGLQFVAFSDLFIVPHSPHLHTSTHSTASLFSYTLHTLHTLHTQAWITSSTNDTHESENL